MKSKDLKGYIVMHHVTDLAQALKNLFKICIIFIKKFFVPPPKID